MWLSLFATLTLRFNFILLKFAEQWLWNVCQPSLPAQPCPNASGSLCIAWGSPRGSVTVNLSNSSCPLSSHQASNLYNTNTVLGCLPSPLCITLSSVSEVMTQWNLRKMFRDSFLNSLRLLQEGRPFLGLSGLLSNTWTEQKTILGRGTRVENSRVGKPRRTALPHSSQSWILGWWGY